MIIENLEKLENESKKKKIPIIGKEKGKWLLEKVQTLKPKSILELGTANGYSGIILANSNATLTTIEQNSDIAREAEQNFIQYHINATVIIGDCVNVIKHIPNDSFDIIFIDFAKKKYIEVLEDAIRVTKKEGHIIADNITMEGCKNFKEAIMSDKRLNTEIIDIKDGLSISKKI